MLGAARVGGLVGGISKGQRVDENSQPCHTVSGGGRSSYEAYTGVSVWKAGQQNVKPGETFSLNCGTQMQKGV